MMQAAPALDSSWTQMQAHAPSVLLRTMVIGLTAFLTVVDLFATQAILPSLTRAYRVTPAAMGFAVNASTMGMAAAGLIVSVLSQRIDRRFGILVSLALLSIPTALLAIAPDLTTFTVLRVAQGLCMASAFTLTLAYLGEEFIGFCILFAFIGTFTYVNFVLVRPPLSLGPMELGFVYFVFLPSIVTTLLAGRATHRWGIRPTLWGSLAMAGVGP